MTNATDPREVRDFLRDKSVAQNDVMHATEAAHTARVYPPAHRHGNTHVIIGKTCNVTIAELDNGRCRIHFVDADEAGAAIFWERLAQRPNVQRMMREAKKSGKSRVASPTELQREGLQDTECSEDQPDFNAENAAERRGYGG